MSASILCAKQEKLLLAHILTSVIVLQQQRPLRSVDIWNDCLWLDNVVDVLGVVRLNESHGVRWFCSFAMQHSLASAIAQLIYPPLRL